MDAQEFIGNFYCGDGERIIEIGDHLMYTDPATEINKEYVMRRIGDQIVLQNIANPGDKIDVITRALLELCEFVPQQGSE